MFTNYMKIAYRNLVRHKGYSLLNIFGLSIGMACSILILMWVNDEVNFDRFHEKLDEMFIVSTIHEYGTDIIKSSGSPPAVGPAIKDEYPEIINTTRIVNGEIEMVVSNGEKRFIEKARSVDPSFLEIFSFPLSKGDAKTALSDPYSIVMSEELARKYFGNEDPIGRVVRIENVYDLVVTGIVKDPAQDTRFNFSMLVPIKLISELWEMEIDTWYNCSFVTVALLQKNTPYKDLSEKLTGRVKQSDSNSNIDLFLAPYSDYYLFRFGEGGGRYEQVRTFAVIAFLVLLIACINFMNLTTARSSSRSKEVGLRKVVGAYRKSIIRQFLGESVLMSFLALAIAIVLVLVLLPVFNDLSGKNLSLSAAANINSIAALIGMTLFTGIVAGSYPALLLSSFKPVTVLKGQGAANPKGSLFRKILVVTQFSLSITLIIATIIIYNQLFFMQNKKLGLDKEQVIYFRIQGPIKERHAYAKQEFLQDPEILSVSFSQALPTGVYWNGNGWDWAGRGPDTDPQITYLYVDPDFDDIFNIEMSGGKFLSDDLLAENRTESNYIVINETLAKILNMESPVGQTMDRGNASYTISGVVKDFHFKPVSSTIGPLIIGYRPENFNYIYLRVKSNDLSKTIDNIGQVFLKYNPEFPFDYRFLDEAYGRLYRTEKIIGKLFRYFAFLAVFISCLGLFGLASFMVEQRTKEIGIRKVLGSSVKRIVFLFSKEFIKWVVASNIIAWPLAWYLADKWLSDYPYRIEIGIGVFLLSGILSIIIALLTVSYQSISAAKTNPVNALKYE